MVAATAEDGLALARAHQTSAIVLDVGLPDRFRLAVLDALKRDPRTRHVPVHVVSVNDYARTALAMGAAGYALKPIARDKLVDAKSRPRVEVHADAPARADGGDPLLQLPKQQR